MSSGGKKGGAAAAAAAAAKPKAGASPSPTTPAAAAVAASPAPASVTPVAAGTFTPSLPPAAQLQAGATLRIRTSLAAEPFEALLVVHDAPAGLLLVERQFAFDHERNYNQRAQTDANAPGDGPRDYALLNVKHVSVEFVAPPSAPRAALLPLSMPAINAKIAAAQQERMEEKNSLGVGVTPEGQKLFDAIRKTTPCVWSGSSFIVLDAVRVSPPYTVAACQTVAQPPATGANAKRQSSSTQAAAAEVMLARVRKIVDAERYKLKLTQ